MIIATTALVSLYTKVVYDMAIVLNEDFYTVYAWVGLWNTLFVLFYSFCGLSNIIKYSTRSVEEVGQKKLPKKIPIFSWFLFFV